MNNKITGKYGEWLAGRYLVQKGYKILSKNYKTPAGEIDIVARDGEKIVFVEVKTRKSDRFGKPFEAVNYKKREKIIKNASLYLSKFKELPSVRFDVISINLQNKDKSIEHIEDAFEMS